MQPLIGHNIKPCSPILLRTPQVSVHFPLKEVHLLTHDQPKVRTDVTYIGTLMVMLLFPEAYRELQEGVGGYLCLRLRQASPRGNRSPLGLLRRINRRLVTC